MSNSKKLTLRVQSTEGTSRVEAETNDSTTRLYERVRESIGLASFAFVLYKDRSRRDEIHSSKTVTLKDQGLRHGDMLFLTPLNGAKLFDTDTSSDVTNKIQNSSSEAGTSALANILSTPVIQEDEVDLELYKQSGKIPRERDEKLCRHNSKGCCVHCSPLEPWDEGYLERNKIKHMSFHAYLRKVAGKFRSLEEAPFAIRAGCKEHPPWPRGICSGCQPGAVTLARQPFRHVDYVVFQQPALPARFLAYWRASGHQRAGLLLGTHEPHPVLPLGISARVHAVYEPPQASSRDHVTLERDPDEPRVLRLAAALGWRVLGWIFSDLLPHPDRPGAVRCTRGAETHFLSAQECIMAGHFQNRFPNPCRHAAAGHFGSKFVTVCVSGDAAESVGFEGYQVSAQCQTLVRHAALLPTKDAPELGYVRDSSAQQYVPDVFHGRRDEYGNEVQVASRRVPCAFLLVSLPVGAEAAPEPPPPPPAFPVENRALPGHLQTPEALHRHLETAPDALAALSDFHALLYLGAQAGPALPEELVLEAARAVRAKDARAANQWRRRASPLLLALAPAAGWLCATCTYRNAPAAVSCDMCALPRTGQ